ncbi:hypothetical protein [Pseudarthrobacter oxydans]
MFLHPSSAGEVTTGTAPHIPVPATGVTTPPAAVAALGAGSVGIGSLGLR